VNLYGQIRNEKADLNQKNKLKRDTILCNINVSLLFKFRMRQMDAGHHRGRRLFGQLQLEYVDHTVDDVSVLKLIDQRLEHHDTEDANIVRPIIK